MDKKTLIRTFALVVMVGLVDILFIGMILLCRRYNLIDDVASSGYVTSLIGANIIIARAWWKNNNITEEAKEAQHYLDILKMHSNLGELDGYVEDEYEEVTEEGEVDAEC